ncbi:MAG: hypothetical protein KDA80_05765 [Planctomycetaceae bacterium]|nr:hypothetical protein [Planctomycetaceae bacterium]
MMIEGKHFGFIVLGFLNGDFELVPSTCVEEIADQKAALIEAGYQGIADLLEINRQSPEPIPPLLIRQSLTDRQAAASNLLTLDIVADGKFKGDDIHAWAKLGSSSIASEVGNEPQAEIATRTSLEITANYFQRVIEITGIPEDDPTEIDLGEAASILLGEVTPGEDSPFDLADLPDPTGFESLANLTRVCILKPGIANSLCAKLQAASNAFDRNQTKVMSKQLGAYRKELKAQIGKSITLEKAELLREISEAIEE